MNRGLRRGSNASSFRLANENMACIMRDQKPMQLGYIIEKLGGSIGSQSKILRTAFWDVLLNLALTNTKTSFTNTPF